MTCEHCKNMRICATEASCAGQMFDVNFDGEHGCTSFEVGSNADRIRAMSDEELAEFLEGDYGNMAVGCALEWLKQPVSGNER